MKDFATAEISIHKYTARLNIIRFLALLLRKFKEENDAMTACLIDDTNLNILTSNLVPLTSTIYPNPSVYRYLTHIYIYIYIYGGVVVYDFVCTFIYI